ncbi:hypothetical protein [Hoeflea sp.]|uniref:hypothetical protein n=1 Tax=Hoeflea sp. TaxID=1940281 RepID=UPI001992A1BC|nr:hypothetical protein [Hoeflea sp.]MBC7284140.1 hypothetical protein [Hoeflea sp.]
MHRLFGRQSEDFRVYWSCFPNHVRRKAATHDDKLHSLTGDFAWLDVWSKLLFDKNFKLAGLDHAIYGYRSS